MRQTLFERLLPTCLCVNRTEPITLQPEQRNTWAHLMDNATARTKKHVSSFDGKPQPDVADLSCSAITRPCRAEPGGASSGGVDEKRARLRPECVLKHTKTIHQGASGVCHCGAKRTMILRLSYQSYSTAPVLKSRLNSKEPSHTWPSGSRS